MPSKSNSSNRVRVCLWVCASVRPCVCREWNLSLPRINHRKSKERKKFIQSMTSLSLNLLWHPQYTNIICIRILPFSNCLNQWNTKVKFTLNVGILSIPLLWPYKGIFQTYTFGFPKSKSERPITKYGKTALASEKFIPLPFFSVSEIVGERKDLSQWKKRCGDNTTVNIFRSPLLPLFQETYRHTHW